MTQPSAGEERDICPSTVDGMGDRDIWDLDLVINGNEVGLRGPLENLLVVDERVLILMRISKGERRSRNVEAYDVNGKKLWTIEAPALDVVDGEDNYYVSLGYYRGTEKVTLRDRAGTKYELDPRTGVTKHAI